MLKEDILNDNWFSFSSSTKSSKPSACSYTDKYTTRSSDFHIYDVAVVAVLATNLFIQNHKKKDKEQPIKPSI